MKSDPPKWGKKKAVSAEDIYKLYFHGPSFQVLDAAQSYRSNVLGRLNKDLVMDATGKPGPMSTPLLIELCFQTAGLWEAGATGTLALPASVGKTHRLFTANEWCSHLCRGQTTWNARET